MMLTRLLVLAFFAVRLVLAQDVIFFEREFPGAVPEYFKIELTRSGSAVYLERDQDPVELNVGEIEAEDVFKRAADLDFFREPLASRRKVASTGRKMLRYESDGVVVGVAEFDYSESGTAREVAVWFVRLAGTQQHLQELNRVYRFDRLGVNKALVNLEEAFERDRIVAPELLEPILDKIVRQPRIVHLARARAEGLLERIRVDRD